ncbi:hypothetical protein E2980_03460 [Cohnella luojiensis]|uniref:Hemolysin XhlA n=2 Tax=Cohnella luojiensis TaxID=652876 RepID=A0A4Y8M7T9_9BACL|nr:hypothetical protein E2980_03460 [Cohnella luojiensis]
MVRVETKIDAMTDVKATADIAKDIAQEAHISVRSAHHRIDRIDKIINWVGTTIIGAIILAAVAFILKGGLTQ